MNVVARAHYSTFRYHRASLIRIHDVLVSFAGLLAPRTAAPLGQLGASAATTRKIEENLDSRSEEFCLAAQETINGELAEQAHIMSYIISPLNYHLRIVLAESGLRIYWRVVGGGSAGRSDIELVLERFEGILTLAVCEIKTDKAMTDQEMRQIATDVVNGSMYMAADQTVTLRGQETVERRNLPTRCKVVQQVSQLPPLGSMNPTPR